MKKIRVIEEKKVPGLFGMKTVKEEKILKVDDKTYRKAMKARSNKPISLDEMIMFDLLDGD